MNPIYPDVFNEPFTFHLEAVRRYLFSTAGRTIFPSSVSPEAASFVRLIRHLEASRDQLFAALDLPRAVSSELAPVGFHAFRERPARVSKCLVNARLIRVRYKATTAYAVDLLGSLGFFVLDRTAADIRIANTGYAGSPADAAIICSFDVAHEALEESMLQRERVDLSSFNETREPWVARL